MHILLGCCVAIATGCDQPRRAISRSANKQIDGGIQTVGQAAGALTRASNCAQVERWVREAALTDMSSYYDFLQEEYLGGHDIWLAFRAASNEQGASEFSTTNNQVEGVDEADFVKNDGRYIYQVDHNVLRIIEAWPAAKTHEVSSLLLEGTPLRLLVRDDRAIVFSSVIDPARRPLSVPGDTASYLSCGSSGCGTVGEVTTITVFDIRDRAAPRELRRLDILGKLIAARRIGPAIHTVIQSRGVGFKTEPYSPTVSNLSQIDGGPDARAAKIAEDLAAARARNEVSIRSEPWVNALPEVRDGDRTFPADCGRVYYEPGTGGVALTSILSFDITTDEPPAHSILMSTAGTVYASEETLYLAARQRSDYGRMIDHQLDPIPTVTSLHAFRIGADANALSYLATGAVKGRLKDQFSMDEHEGNLRVASTTGYLPNPDTHNTLSVLGQRSGRLELLGQIDDLARGEDIRSVRFDRDRGYMVTFKKTDPLFAFDLSEPTEPKLLGELKIPGFSTYIHRLDDTHLLTIGFDADDAGVQGKFAYFDGVILQIFDVSDPSALSLTHKLTLGTRGSSSEALSNHLAFNLFKGRLAMPMTICEGGGDGKYGTDMTFSGLILYDVSVSHGFREMGRVANPQQSDGTYDSKLCANWWMSAKSEIKRSIFMEDYVYALSPNMLHVQDTRALGKDLVTLPFAAQ